MSISLEGYKYQSHQEEEMKKLIVRALDSQNSDLYSVAAQLVNLTREAGMLPHISDEQLLDSYFDFLGKFCSTSNNKHWPSAKEDLAQIMLENAQSKYNLAYAVWLLVKTCNSNNCPKEENEGILRRPKATIESGPGRYSLTSR